jgi:hypothetical protein
MEVLETWDRRSAGMLDFLDFCVRSMQMDPLFVYLVQEYRANPTVPKAVALFHTFCAPAAVAKVSVNTDDPQIQNAMRPITVSWTRMQAALVFGPGNGAPPLSPPASIFDRLAEEIMRAGILARLKRDYRQGAKMNRIQQHFVEKIWQPIIRPHLVAAGFWRIAEVA